MPDLCQLGRLFHPCHAPRAGTCQYCGRCFCERHGSLLEEGEEVCSRRLCQAKVIDLHRHLIYRAAAGQRSAHGFCGFPDCGEPRWGQCSKCGVLFCRRHLHDRDQVTRRGLLAASRPASFCDHCLARRKLWART